MVAISIMIYTQAVTRPHFCIPIHHHGHLSKICKTWLLVNELWLKIFNYDSSLSYDNCSIGFQWIPIVIASRIELDRELLFRRPQFFLLPLWHDNQSIQVVDQGKYISNHCVHEPLIYQGNVYYRKAFNIKMVICFDDKRFPSRLYYNHWRTGCILEIYYTIDVVMIVIILFVDLLYYHYHAWLFTVSLIWTVH
jgi:hypothetical protein